jgi:REP element-mobilizing transposase RayT
MARRTRCSDAGYVYHVRNRAVGRATLFDQPADYAAFEQVLRQAWRRTGMRRVADVALPNHWHLVCASGEQEGSGDLRGSAKGPALIG